jgi:hypothetical protein
MSDTAEMPDTVKVNALVSTLERYDRTALLQLQKQYPAEERLLQPGIELGVTATRRTAVLVDLAKRATATVRDRINPTIDVVRRKLRLARRLRLSGSVVAIISSAGLISAVSVHWSNLGFVTAGINALASLTTLFANYFDGPVTGSRRLGGEVLSTLIQLSVNVLKVEQELALMDADIDSEQKARALVRRANELAAEFHEVETLIGIRSAHANTYVEGEGLAVAARA